MTALRLRSLDAGRFHPRYAQQLKPPGTAVLLPPSDSPSWKNPVRAFAWGMASVTSTVMALVLFTTYLGIGALAHDTHFSLGWALLCTVLVWAGPAQIILISTLGSGATVVQAAIAVTVSAIRLFPMVVSVLAGAAHAADQAAPAVCWRRISSRSPFGSNVSACCRMCRASGGSSLPMGSAPGWSWFASPRPRSAMGLPPTCHNCSPPRSCC